MSSQKLRNLFGRLTRREREAVEKLAESGARAAAHNPGLDLGFGQRVVEGRMVNPDGSFNVIRRGLPWWQSFSPFHWLLTVSTGTFLCVIFSGFVLLNLLFASIYYSIGPSQFNGMNGETPGILFSEAFFFSAQTITTIGYGGISPKGLLAGYIAAFEGLMGVLSLALATGLVYGRFSRPVARILFSEAAVIAPYRDHSALMFRIANRRRNQLIEMQVQMTFSYVVQAADGSRKRMFLGLELERAQVNFFPTSWTIVHPITESSPLYGLDKNVLDSGLAEILVLVKGFDDTFNQTIHARSSYRYDEIRWGHKFVPMLEEAEDGSSIVRLDLLSSTRETPLPEQRAD